MKNAPGQMAECISSIDDPEWDAAIVLTIRAYGDTLDPDIWIEVAAPYFMEQAVPDAIIEQLHTTIFVAVKNVM